MHFDVGLLSVNGDTAVSLCKPCGTTTDVVTVRYWHFALIIRPHLGGVSNEPDMQVMTTGKLNHASKHFTDRLVFLFQVVLSDVIVRINH